MSLILIEKLKDICVESEFVGKSRHASAIVYKNTILSTGKNKLKSHPKMKEFQDNPERIFLHAEMDAIVKCINRYGLEILKKSDLYVVRLGRKGQLLNSKPCDGCESAINFYGLKNVYHS